MARINTLTNFLTDVADSIRSKTGKSEPIACEDFDAEIESIETGGGGGSTRLPSEYQEVEYIGITSGNGYIDTEFIPTYYSKAIARGLMTSGTFLLGEDTSWANKGFGILSRYSYFSDKWKSAAMIRNSTHDFIVSKDGYYIDNVLLDNFAGASTFTADYSLYVFANHRSGSPDEYGKGTIYYLQLYENNVLKKYFIPCYRKSDNTIGLYDLVDKKFHESQGTGTWIKGNNHDTPAIVNLQTKSTTITENTTTNITPDEGYSGLESVIVTTNVQPNLESKSITISTNTSTIINPTSGKDGLSSVIVTTNIPTGGETIPSEYTQIEYLETNALGYIKSGYKPNDKTQWEVVCQLLHDGAYDGCVFGSRTTGNSQDEFILWHNNNNNATTETISPRRGYTSGSSLLKTYTDSDFAWRKLRVSSNSFYVDDTRVGNMYSATIPSSNLELYIFGLNNNGTADSRYYRGRLKYLKMLEGVDTVIKLLPVRRNADDRVGLYDVINNVFYDNELSTNFIAGPDIQ